MQIHSLENLQDAFKFHSFIVEDHYKEILLESFVTFFGLPGYLLFPTVSSRLPMGYPL